MTIRDLLKCAMCPVWITFSEDPNSHDADPEVRLWCTSGSEWTEASVLSDELLDSDVHLLTVSGGAVYVSVFDV